MLWKLIRTTTQQIVTKMYQNERSKSQNSSFWLNFGPSIPVSDDSSLLNALDRNFFNRGPFDFLIRADPSCLVSFFYASLFVVFILFLSYLLQVGEFFGSFQFAGTEPHITSSLALNYVKLGSPGSPRDLFFKYISIAVSQCKQIQAAPFSY